MVMTATTAGWLLYEIMSATEAPGTALATLQSLLLACALIGLIGSAVMYATER
jgi:hypothetical protein